MLEETQKKGTLTELQCILDLTKNGIRCLKPIDESSKYDIVADIDNKFIRIQCKTASWVTDTVDTNVAFMINTYCQTTNTKGTTRHKYTKNEIDYFYTFFQGQGYLVSIEEANGTTFRWRYEYPKSRTKKWNSYC